MDESRLAAYKLPRGRHGLSREHVAENQRWRLLGAAADLLAEAGYRNLTTHKIAARAAVSSQTFYAHFRGRDDCLRAAFEAAAKAVAESGQIPGAIEMLAADPSLAALFGLELRAAVPATASAFAAFAEALAPEPRARLLLGAALILVSDPSLRHRAVPSRRPAEVAALVGLLSAPLRRRSGPPRRG